MRSFALALTGLFAFPALAQCDRWQQSIRCDLDVDLDVGTNRFTGIERLVYTNNSPDTLRELYFHLYFNAFRPGSEMDVRSRTIADPDPRVSDRIQKLKPEEMGELQCFNPVQDGKAVTAEHLGTVLRLRLAAPLLPRKSTTIAFNFRGQVPVQIRRSGRDNAEGVAFSMTQWYPKVAVYDHRGWHNNPYVGREFYGEWGDYNVSISLDSSYTVAATGTLTNASQVGHGYAAPGKPSQRADGRITWKFSAPKVHDFAWAADPDYKHTTAQVPGGPLLRFFHKNTPEMEAVWKDLPGYMVRSFQIMNKRFGTYPYPEYAFVQGGDGGMEYPMLTLITGNRKLGSLVGVSVHESVHSWYYGLLGSDEGSFPWMDEGFTEYASDEVMRELFPGQQQGRSHADAQASYLRLAASPNHEPMSVHSDHFRTNNGYSTTAYSKGEFFLDQLGTVIGDSTLHRGLLRYFNACKFKHPEPVDVRRSMEKESGLQLDWYFNEWINTVNELDYAVKGAVQRNDSTFITLERKGEMLMPVDVAVVDANDQALFFHVPLSLSLGARPDHDPAHTWKVLPAWTWTNPTYTFGLPGKLSMIRLISVDPLARQADAHRDNDELHLDSDTEGVIQW